MLLPTAATASFSSRRLPHPVRTQGGAGAPLLTGAAKFRAPTTRLQRSSSFTFSCACSPSPDQNPGDEDSARVLFDEYSDLSKDIPWEPDDIWRTFAAYFLILHIPFSFGGLGVVAKVLHSSSLDPLTTVASTAMLQLGELTLALALLQYTAKPHNEVRTFFAGKFSLQRSWVKETALWFGCIMSVVSLTSLLADQLIGPEDAYDHMLKEILSDGPTSRPLFLNETEGRCHHKLNYVQRCAPFRKIFLSIVHHWMCHRFSLLPDWNFGCLIHHPQFV